MKYEAKFSKAGFVMGPYSEEELRSKVASGALGLDYLVRPKGEFEWTTIASLLRVLYSAPPPSNIPQAVTPFNTAQEPAANNPPTREQRDTRSNAGELKICPFCRQQIRQEAVKCRYCGEWLEDENHSVPSRIQKGNVSEPYPSVVRQATSPSGFHIWPIVRDVAMLWVLTFLGGIIAGAARLRHDTEPVWASTGAVLSNVIFGIIGFCIIGCLAKGNRWKHLGYVALFSWLTSIVNVFLGLPFEMWLGGAYVPFVLMGAGGGLSYLFKRQP